MTVYLLHFDRPFHHAKHYVGYVRGDLERRIEQHRRGDSNSAKLLQAIRNEGIGFEVARVWKGKDGKFERMIKNTNNTRRYCPICQGKKVRKYKPKTKEEPVLVDMSAPVVIPQPAEELAWLPY